MRDPLGALRCVSATNMYKSCIYCHGTFQKNETIEHLPIGRRIAYDLERGRLWAVCHRCAGWNLVPFSDRWEALEECERAFEATNLIAAGEEITLARVPEGLDLIRVGAPVREEFAIWRYGSQLGRRRLQRLARNTAVTVVAAAGVSTALAVPIVGAAGLFFGGLWMRVALDEYEATPEAIAFVRDEKRKLHAVRRRDLSALRIGRQTAGKSDWTLSFGTDFAVTGPQALTTLGRPMPLINRTGGTSRHQKAAVQLLNAHGSGEQLLADPRTHQSSVGKLRRPVRLALEMAAQEEAENAAMAGDLYFLEQAWREAESLAAIADGLLMPEYVTRLLARMKQNQGQGA